MVEVHLHVPDHYMVYRDRVSVQLETALDVEWAEAVVPEGTVRPARADGDPPRMVLEGDVLIMVPVMLSREVDVGPAHLRVTLEHQGCSRGLCYPLVRRSRETVLHVVESDSE
jgi:hypothetical protein